MQDSEFEGLKDLKLLTPAEAARVLGLHAERLRQLHRKGRIRALVTSSGRRLFLYADIEKLGAERAQAGLKGPEVRHG